MFSPSGHQTTLPIVQRGAWYWHALDPLYRYGCLVTPQRARAGIAGAPRSSGESCQLAQPFGPPHRGLVRFLKHTRARPVLARLGLPRCSKSLQRACPTSTRQMLSQPEQLPPRSRQRLADVHFSAAAARAMGQRTHALGPWARSRKEKIPTLHPKMVSGRIEARGGGGSNTLPAVPALRCALGPHTVVGRHPCRPSLARVGPCGWRAPNCLSRPGRARLVRGGAPVSPVANLRLRSGRSCGWDENIIRASGTHTTFPI